MIISVGCPYDTAYCSTADRASADVSQMEKVFATAYTTAGDGRRIAAERRAVVFSSLSSPRGGRWREAIDRVELRRGGRHT